MDMNSALDRFRLYGDYQPFLEVIDAKESPQYALQKALGKASNRKERDTYEDISYCIASKKDTHSHKLELAEKVYNGAKQEFGEFIGEFITKPEVFNFINGIKAELEANGESAIPVNGLIAAIGYNVAERVQNTLPVSRNSFGETRERINPTCQICGGSQGGKGIIACNHCVPPETLQKLLSGVRVPIYGCKKCNYTPIKECSCIYSVDIPKQPKNGQILKGKYKLSGQAKYCTLIIDDGGA